LEDALERVKEDHFPQPGQQRLVRYVSTSYGYSRTMGRTPGQPETGSHVAQVLVEMLPADLRTVGCDPMLRAWR